MPFVQVADVADDMKLVDDTKQKISKLAQPMSVYADKGSVLVTLQGSIGRVAITQYRAFVDRTVLIFDKYNQDIDKTFWAYIIKEKFIDEARKAPGGTIKTITKEALSDFDLMLPSYDEQQKLGAFLVSIDTLITLHQRQYISFMDDNQTWEQRKFAKVFDGLQNNTLSRAELNYESGDVKNVHYGDILIKLGDYIDASEVELPYISESSKADKFSGSFLKDGDIVIADTAEDDTVGKCTEIQGSEGMQILAGLHTIACRPKEKYGPKFLGYYINSPAYHNQLKPLMQGIKVTSISKSALQETDVLIPKSIDEQTAIGECFSNLDALITLHRRTTILKERSAYK